MKKLFLILLIPITIYPQGIEIKSLSSNINTNNAEINFIQLNDSTAFFTSITDSENNIESSIYMTSLHNNEWSYKKYSKFNSDIFNSANIFFSPKGKVFFTICDIEMINCRIVCFEKERKGFVEILPIINEEVNTQAHFAKHNNQEVLYFVSDRKGGFGGMDIWLSMIDKNGNFGVPINAGERINTSLDEITPFFNPYENTLYFSSNRKGGLGGFDVYKSNGKLNLWKKTSNVKQFNTKDDEMYLSFYSKDKGYFSSNRKGAKYETTEFCCNDIFSFEIIEIDTIFPEINWVDFEPLELYFHNDEPDCCTMKTITNQTYKDAYISYFKLVDEYKSQNDSLNNFFETTLKLSYNRLKKLLEMLLLELDDGKKIELQIRGFASPLHKFEYNINLSQRRIQSVINYISTYHNTVLSKYLKTGQLTIVELPLGESKVSKNTSDNPYDIKNSIYSLEAIMERKIEIVKVILKD